MADQQLKTLVTQGLQAMKAGSDVAKMATADIEKDASHPELKSALATGNKKAAEWAQRIDQAIAEAGNSQAIPNEVLEAHFNVSKKIRQKAPDATTRDLGIVAAGQMALHYWLAAFGTMANYAANLNLTQTAQNMKKSADEAKEADQGHTALAEKLLAA